MSEYNLIPCSGRCNGHYEIHELHCYEVDHPSVPGNIIYEPLCEACREHLGVSPEECISENAAHNKLYHRSTSVKDALTREYGLFKNDNGLAESTIDYAQKLNRVHAKGIGMIWESIRKHSNSIN